MNFWRSSPSGTDVGRADVGNPLPSPPIRSAISVWLVIHFALVGVSLTAVVAASPLQIQLLAFAAPYLNPLQLRIDGRPIFLTHGEGDDQPHQVEWLAAGSTEWQRGVVRGSRGSERLRRYFRYAGAIATAAGRDDTATASMLALPLVDEVMWQVESGQWEGGTPVRMRVVRLGLDPESPTPRDEPSKSTQWEAAIVPQGASGRPVAGGVGAGQWALVTIEGRRLNAPPGSEDSTTEEGSAADASEETP